MRTYDGHDLASLERRFGRLTDHEKALLGNGIRGGARGYAECLVTSEVDSVAVTGTTTPTSILPAAAVRSIDPATWKIGAYFTFELSGRISNIVTTPGTLLIDVRLGASTVILPGVAMQLNAVAKTNVAWTLRGSLTCRSIGNGTVATVMGNALFTSESIVGSAAPAAGGNGSLHLQPVTPVVGTGFDSTVSQTLNVFATWSLNNANSILTHSYCLMHMTGQ